MSNDSLSQDIPLLYKGTWLDPLELSARTRNAIEYSQIASIADLRRMSYMELINLPGLGDVGAREILEKLELHADLDNNATEKSKASGASTDGQSESEDSRSDTISVYSLSLSPRTANALYNSGIEVLSDLKQYTPTDLLTLGGFGKKAYDELMSLIESPDFKKIVALKVPEKIPLDDFLSTKINKSHLAIFDSYTGLTENRSNATLQSVSEEYGVTRERIRQIVKKVTDKVMDAINNEIVEPDVYDTLMKNINKPIALLPEVSGIYRKEGIVRLFTDNKLSGLGLYRSPHLRSEWLVDKTDNTMDEQIESALSALKIQVSPVRISELSETCHIDENILYDLDNVTITDNGLIVLNSNKVALGTDIRQKIIDYMDKIVRPVTVNELSHELNLSLNQVRGRLYNMREIVNVGKSTYGLVKYGYTGETITDLAKRLLQEEGQPLHVDKITNFVTKQKVIEDSSVSAMMSLQPETFVNIGSGYYALSEWGFASAAQPTKHYEVPVIDAVFSIFNEIDEPLTPKDVLARVKIKYGQKSTDRPSSISAACVRLYSQGVLVKLGTDHSPYYKLKNNFHSSIDGQ